MSENELLVLFGSLVTVLFIQAMAAWLYMNMLLQVHRRFHRLVKWFLLNVLTIPYVCLQGVIALFVLGLWYMVYDLGQLTGLLLMACSFGSGIAFCYYFGRQHKDELRSYGISVTGKQGP